MTENDEIIRDRIRQESPWWLPEAVDDRIHDKIVGALERTLSQVSEDPLHPLRERFDVGLNQFIEKLRTSPASIARAEAIKEQVLDKQREGVRASRSTTTSRGGSDFNKLQDRVRPRGEMYGDQATRGSTSRGAATVARNNSSTGATNNPSEIRAAISSCKGSRCRSRTCCTRASRSIAPSCATRA